jgi:hypothetical protein
MAGSTGSQPWAPPCFPPRFTPSQPLLPAEHWRKRPHSCLPFLQLQFMSPLPRGGIPVPLACRCSAELRLDEHNVRAARQRVEGGGGALVWLLRGARRGAKVATRASGVRRGGEARGGAARRVDSRWVIVEEAILVPSCSGFPSSWDGLFEWPCSGFSSSGDWIAWVTQMTHSVRHHLTLLLFGSTQWAFTPKT